MPARLLFTCALLILALTSCGDDKSSGGSDEKQSQVSAEAYPAVEKFVTTDVEIDRYGPICDELATVSKEDKVAAASEHACRKVARLAADFKPFKAQTAACDDPDCVADKAEPAFTRFLKDFRELGRTFNSEIKDALEPGDCLETLTLPKADLEAIDSALERLPVAMKALRRGDSSGFRDVLDFDFSGERDPKPCKP